MKEEERTGYKPLEPRQFHAVERLFGHYGRTELTIKEISVFFVSHLEEKVPYWLYKRAIRLKKGLYEISPILGFRVKPGSGVKDLPFMRTAPRVPGIMEDQHCIAFEKP